ncbi:SDR family oxidoreductase [Shewanella violacea]|uniref:Oxidoreductase, short chain dehydrogenase/reductase family n=1 Tax=Shewanella violacea (strain JCM 10179 / CIP 106290 / LMG 19151 / DSS12) TaxID=637905 RepID=D4ZKB3_SHEVD|nr:SDR family oxidoreductase [Shewanella violacea]BAJ02112.1 oxidoreductase, short chain dehydrogenase/reductase family [Shewanella violacea DSS12]
MTKHLFITGANRGLGLTMVKQYLDSGWIVTACCREPEQADELTSLLEKHESLSVFQLDVTNYQELQQLAASLQGEPIDLLINNAGYYGPKDSSLGDIDVEEWRKVFEINAIAPLKILEAFRANLKLATSSTLAILSSKMGSMADNSSGGTYIYRSSKAAVNSVVKSLSVDLTEDNIAVVALHPGWVRTQMGGINGLIDTHESVTGLKRVLDKLDMSQTGLFLDYRGQEIPW